MFFFIDGCIMCDNTMVNVNWLQFLFLMIILLIIPIVLLKMVYVNNGLRSTDIVNIITFLNIKQIQIKFSTLGDFFSETYIVYSNESV